MGMSTLRFSTVGLGLSLVVALVAGCSGGGSSTGTDGINGTNGTNANQADGGGTSASASAKFTCCLNDVYYVCSDKAAVDRCASGGAADFNACMADCAGNPSCMAKCKPGAAATPDPTACTKRVGEKCPPTSPADPSNPSGPVVLCSGVGGEKCSYDTQCGSGNHCTGGCCQGNTTNTSCSYDTQCGSGNHCSGGASASQTRPAARAATTRSAARAATAPPENASERAPNAQPFFGGSRRRRTGRVPSRGACRIGMSGTR